MNREDRAKQFLAFDALKGLREELKRREENRLKEKKKELSDERIAELSQRLAVLKRGDRITVTFYYNGHYIDLSGQLQKINVAYKYLEICDNKISFSDVYQIIKID
ncbi:MAG: YolD-like family protein [Clostridia bacterium]|nr:YolD-like family protein [Clostridia bacterium]